MAGCGRDMVLLLFAAYSFPLRWFGLAGCCVMVYCLDPLYSVVLLALVALMSIISRNGCPCVGGCYLSADFFISFEISFGLMTVTLHFRPLKRSGECVTPPGHYYRKCRNSKGRNELRNKYRDVCHIMRTRGRYHLAS